MYSTRAERISDLPYYTEGPAVDSGGNVFFTTLSGGAILRISPTGQASTWAESACPNGQTILADDVHLVCDSKLAMVRRFDRNGKFIGNLVEKRCADVEVSVPNDVVADVKGNVYFTDSVRHVGKVFYVAQNGDEHVVADHLDYPNGLVLSADERWLYVAESYKNRILKIDLTEMPDCSVHVHAGLPKNPSGEATGNLPDGVRRDREGNLWIAHYGMQALQVLSPAGAHLQTIDTAIPLTSNLVFEREDVIVVTGGYGEPGPGAVSRIYLMKP